MPTLHKPASQLALYLRLLVYPQTGLMDEPGSPLVWYSHMRGCASVRLVPLLNRRPEDVETLLWTDGCKVCSADICWNRRQHGVLERKTKGNMVCWNGRQKAAWCVGTEDKRQHGGDMQLRCCDHGLLT